MAKKRKIPPSVLKGGTVKLPGWIPILCLIGSIVMFGFLIACYLDGGGWPMWVFFGFGLLGLVLTWMSLRFRIDYDQDGIAHRDEFGRVKQYSFRDLTAIKERMPIICLYFGQERFELDLSNTSGGYELYAFSRAMYSSLHGGSSLPPYKGMENDIFRGNSPDRGASWLVGYGVMLFVSLGLFVFLLILTIFRFDMVFACITDAVIVLAIIGGLCILSLWFGHYAVKVGRHPERYSKKVIRLFFKDGYIQKKKNASQSEYRIRKHRFCPIADGDRAKLISAIQLGDFFTGKGIFSQCYLP